MNPTEIKPPVFSKQLLDRATVPARTKWSERLVDWWRKITKRDRYYVSRGWGDGWWFMIKHDTKTGISTVVECGKGKPPQ